MTKNINIRDDKLFQDFVYNYEELIDFLCKHSKSMVLECYCYDISLDNFVYTILNDEKNVCIKESFIGIKKIHEHKDCRSLLLEFNITENSRNWLIQHKCMLGFNEGSELINPSFYDAQNRRIMYFNDGVRNTDIDEDYVNIFEQWSKNVIEKKTDVFRDFADELEAAIRNEDKDIVEYFSSENYSYELFLILIDGYDEYYDYYKYIRLKEFYTNKNNINLLIKILVNKVSKKNDLEIVARLFEFYEFDYDIEIVEEYLLTLEKSILITIFNKALFYLFGKEKSYLTQQCKMKIANKMILFWNKMGVNDLQGFPEFIKVKNAWEEAYEYKIKEGLCCSNKRLDLISLLRLAVSDKNQNDKFEYLRSLKSGMRFVRMLAWNSFYGIIGEKDDYEAFELMLTHCQNHKDSRYDAESHYELARCYLNGWGTEKDIEQAKYWFGKAAENGHPKAQEQLDLITENKV